MRRKKNTATSTIRLKVKLLSNGWQAYQRANIYRVIEILPTDTLASLHDEIFQAFDRYEAHMYEFSFGSKRPYAPNAVKFGLPEVIMDVDGEAYYDARKTTLASLELQPRDEFYYLFDFGDDWWHRITVVAVDVPLETNRKYPCVVQTKGDSPPQYGEEDEDDEEE